MLANPRPRTLLRSEREINVPDYKQQSTNQRNLFYRVAMNHVQRQPSTTSAAEPVAARYVRKSDLQLFRNEYLRLLDQIDGVEKKSSDLNEMAAVNLQVANILNGFLNKIRSLPSNLNNQNLEDAVLISMNEMRMLESEAQLRLTRADSVAQANAFDLGGVVVRSMNIKKLLDDVREQVTRLNEGGGGGDGDDDESSEERNPQAVNLEKSDGLYTIIDAEQSPGLDELIGYRDETDTLLNLTRDIRFRGRGLDEVQSSSTNNRPTSIILYGPPGTGKTTSAQAVAKTLSLTYMYVNAENVTSMWTGGTQKNIAKVFRRARIAAKRYGRKTLLLIDEIDGLLKNRQGGQQLSPEEYSRITTFLQMLTPPIGIDNSQIIIIFTTNNLTNLDSAFVNRARQSLFMGYVVRPEDRGKLFKRYLMPYVNVSSWTALGMRLPEFVPRDMVNLSALCRSSVTKKANSLNDGVAVVNVGVGTAFVNLDDSRITLTEQELLELAENMLPATPISSYFTFQPPPRHLSLWLDYNATSTFRPDIREAFMRAAQHSGQIITS